MKWYQKTWGIILMIVLFFPVGLYLLWKHGRCSKKTKWIITILLLFISVVSSSVDINNSTSTTNNSEVVEASSSDNNESAEKSEEIKESESTEENTNIEELKTDNNSKSKADSKIKSGTYKIGTDIPAGEYVVIAKSIAYIECAKDSKGQLDSIIYNDNLTRGSNSYVTVKDGEYFKLQGAEMYPVNEAPSVIPSDGIYKDGMYKVGQDIPAGEYSVISDDENIPAYIEVSNDSRHSLFNISANDNFTGNKYITVEDGQYLKLQRCKIQK